ncbi:MAG: 1,6-anhydro-N-acetylmuramyl-L-alanine amidase AmpD [Gammaproteobacteria bacterium]|jgi:AmpD protein
MKIINGWLENIKKILSPNCDSRPLGTDINLLVIHNISLPPGEFANGNIEKLFTNQLLATAHPYFATILPLQVSAHVLIDREGVLTQFVSFNDRAWHAGASEFQGRPKCNDYSIGIELEGEDNTAYTEHQYRALAELTRCLMQNYPGIILDRIKGHSDIAPGRKTDPGAAFDWVYFKTLLQQS